MAPFEGTWAIQDRVSRRRRRLAVLLLAAYVTVMLGMACIIG